MCFVSFYSVISLGLRPFTDPTRSTEKVKWPIRFSVPSFLFLFFFCRDRALEAPVAYLALNRVRACIARQSRARMPRTPPVLWLFPSLPDHGQQHLLPHLLGTECKISMDPLSIAAASLG